MGTSTARMNERRTGLVCIYGNYAEGRMAFSMNKYEALSTPYNKIEQMSSDTKIGKKNPGPREIDMEPWCRDAAWALSQIGSWSPVRQFLNHDDCRCQIKGNTASKDSVHSSRVSSRQSG